MLTQLCRYPTLRVLLFLTALWGLGLERPARSQQVAINEIFYYPPSTNVREQWLELFNPSASAVNLAGWRMTHGVDFTFPDGARLAPGGYLIVAADQNAFTNRYPDVANFVAGWAGSLNRDGEQLRLENSQGQEINAVWFAPEGDWAVRRLGAPDSRNRQGWEWSAEHNGGGSSLELVDARLPNSCGQNWASSTVSGGTPGRANSVAGVNNAPLVVDVRHFPLVPKSTDPVTVTARLLDAPAVGLEAVLFWRVDGETNFTAATMIDDGAHRDGLAGDQLFGCLLPPHPNGTVVEFYLQVRDGEGHQRDYPQVQPSNGPRTANLVYQVDEGTYSGHQPVLRLIMTQAEYAYLSGQIWGGAPASDALMNGTFINVDEISENGAAGQCVYQCGFRNRGNGTRSAVPHNFHVAFPKDHPWKGREGLNLNTHYTHSQHLGSAIFRTLGLPVADSRPVQVRVNGVNLAKPGQEQFGSYAANELVNGRLVERQFPLDSEGNLYRGVRNRNSGTNTTLADLSWQGPAYTTYTNVYAKENHALENDWTDLIELLDTLNHTPDASYASAVSQVVNVDEWMKYFAVNTLLGNQENGLNTGSGDDFALYRGAKDRRFLLLPYDLDSVMGQGRRTNSNRDGIWAMTSLPVVNRFIRHPDFVPLYFKHLEHLAQSAFSPSHINPLLDHLLSSYVDTTALANFKEFNVSQVDYVLSQFPHQLTVTHGLPTAAGYPLSTAATVALSGTADPVETRAVLVNGTPTAWLAWRGTWSIPSVSLTPGLNRVLIQALNPSGTEQARTTLEIWFDDGNLQMAGGSITNEARWTAAGGPYQLASTLTVAAGATLTIDPGTTLYLGPGIDFVVAPGGRLLAEGTETAPIRFTRTPGTASNWGHLVIEGAIGSPESRVSYTHFEFNQDSSGTPCIEVAGGTVLLDHLTFGNTRAPYLHVDEASFVVQDCLFPPCAAEFEPVHGTGGIQAGGRGLFLRNFFGAPIGYNDTVDFTGGNRPDSPIVQFIDNVFAGTGDDELDLDGTDAWVEGNIFLHVHKNGSPDSASAISGGKTGSDKSEITILGNLFYDCDQAATAKEGNFYTLLNNTIVHQTRTGGLDTDGAVLNFADDGTTEGAGMFLEGNIIYDVEKLLRNATAAIVTLTNNLIPIPWNGPGGGNSTAAPLLRHVPQWSETQFTNWSQAQILRDWFALDMGSPAIGTGPLGQNRGGVRPRGVAVSGAPLGQTRENNAQLTVGPNGTGQGIPAAGFPQGSGFLQFKWRLDGGPWSDETPISQPILLTNLAPGSHRVELSGKNDAGTYQDDPALGPDAATSFSRSWVVDPEYSPPLRPGIRLNEILVRNATILTNLETTPALIELRNAGPSPVDLSGMGLTDSATNLYKFTFPPGTILSAHGLLVLVADSASSGPFLHTGFHLKSAGDDLYLASAAQDGSALLDSIAFGLQIPDYSIGRRTDGSWGLCVPTFGLENIAQPTGTVHQLKINEWLADAQFAASHDFLELYNPRSLPVELGGLYLSDAAGSPERFPIAPLSFIAAQGFAEFIADDSPGLGPDHLNFQLSAEVGLILLSAADRSPIDAVPYQSQRQDVSEGRSPNGAGVISRFPQPSPGGGNPGVTTGETTVTTITVPLVPMTAAWRFNQTDNLDGLPWTTPEFNDSPWPTGTGLLGVEDCGCLPAPGLQTTMALGRLTYYFRTSFVVETNLAGLQLNLTAFIDDGVVVYLNGLPVLTNGMPAAPIGYFTEASHSVGDAQAESFTISAAALHTGTNLLAAEVHQTSPGSSDVVWGLALEASRTVTNFVPAPTLTLALNEVRANRSASSNSGLLAADYIEIYNTSTNPLDLAGLSLTDNSASPRQWVFPTGLTLPGGAHQLIFCDGTAPASATNTGFSLKAKGGVVYLFDHPISGGGLVDAVRYGLQAPDYSLGRVPEGSGNWTLNIPSPGLANTPATLGDLAQLKINEWMADPDKGSDWLELYNSSDRPVALDGLVLTDDLSNLNRSPIQPLSYLGVGAGGFVQFIADGNPDAQADHVNFSLNRSGEVVGLVTLNGTLLDAIAFGRQATGISQGRFPDGSTNVLAFPGTPSPAQSNYLPLADSDQDGLPDTWEMAHFGSLALDGSADSDGDRMTNYQEYLAGTDPTNPADALRLAAFPVANTVVLQFNAAAGVSYSVQFRESLQDGTWIKFADVPAGPGSGVVRVSDPSPRDPTRFYRVISPAQP